MSSQWLASTYINSDSELISAKANERYLAMMSKYIAKAKTFPADAPMTPETARSLHLLKIGVTLPPPNDPNALGRTDRPWRPSSRACTAPANIARIRKTRTAASTSARFPPFWPTRPVPMISNWRPGTAGTPFPRRCANPTNASSSLSNQGAKDLGFANTGELWRSGYDMPPADFQAETDRLWGQVEPLYKQLQCYTKNKLVREIRRTRARSTA